MQKLAILAAFITLIVISFADPIIAADSIYVWYGNVDGSPLPADTGQYIDFNIYIMTTDDAYGADCHICLGVENRCIDSLLSQTRGEIYYPFSEWDLKYFLAPQGAPPNQTGWSSQSFVAFANVAPPYNAPWLHFDEPTLVLKMAGKTARDISLVGELANCLNTGFSQEQGPSNFGDTIGFSYPYAQYFSPVQFAGGGYVAGRVSAPDGDPIPNTVVRDIQTLRTTSTDDNGDYILGGIYQGSHDILFDPPIAGDTTITSVNVTNGQTTTLNVEISGTVDVKSSEPLPDKFELMQNYPNPFNPTTSIEYLLPQQADVSVCIYDIQGRLVARLVDKMQAAGNHKVSWDAGRLPSGMYFYHITAGDFSATKKMVLIK